MSSEPICVYVYINGEIIHGSSDVSKGYKTKSILLNPTMTLSDIITTIQSSIRDNDVTSMCFLVVIFNLF